MKKGLLDNPEAMLVHGERIYLRRVQLKDATEHYRSWMNDKEVNQFMETRHTTHSAEDIRKYIQQMINDENQLFLAICLKEKDQHIGNIKLGPINRIHAYADVSFFIGEKQFWGKGFASEAIKLMTKYAFSDLKLHKLKAGCYANNLGSQKALEKAGYKLEARLRNMYRFNEHFVDCLLFTHD